MLRAGVLALAFLIGLGILFPLATDYAEAGAKKQRKYSKKAKKKGPKKYSKAWWRAYRARKSRQEDLESRKRALRLKRLRMQREREAQIAENGGKWVVVTKWDGEKWVSKNQWIAITSDAPTVPPPDNDFAVKGAKYESKEQKAPVAEKTKNAEFAVSDRNGFELGSASIAVVGPAVGEDNFAGRYKTLSGVSTSALRRTVIDQMIRENGWVVNDYQKEVGGRKVFVVVAQSPGAKGQIQSRLFYFTEVDGQIYSVATNSPLESSGQIADESEKIVTVLQRRSRMARAAIAK